MLHPHYFGFFDHAAAARRELKVVAPLEITRSTALLRSIATESAGGIWCIEKDRFFFHQGCLVASDFIRSKSAGDFVVSFAKTMRCEILFLETGQFSSADQFADYLALSRNMHEVRVCRSEEKRRAAE